MINWETFEAVKVDRPKSHKWTSADIKFLINRWNADYSAAEIAQMMKLSTNSVLGKLYRLRRDERFGKTITREYDKTKAHNTSRSRRMF